MSERILIAGCGDLGMRVAQRLLARGDEVYALRRHPPASDDSGLRWLRGDLTSAAPWEALPQGITQVVYLPTPDARVEDAYRAVFVDGLRHLLATLAPDGPMRVLFVSSTAVYGEQGGEWVDETTSPAPPGFNGRVLLEAERLLAATPLRSIVLRLAGLYGPGRLQLIERLRAAQVSAPHEPVHWANRIHVDDAASAIVHLLNLYDPLPLYLGVDDTPLPLHVLYQYLATLIHAPIVPDGSPPAGIGSKRLSNARLRASGFPLRWPDAREGYAALLAQGAGSRDQL
jgi:nucleoside-diphosphate-sugar epimerase